MKILIDTHIALWATMYIERLSHAGQNILISPENEVFFSVISIWEVGLKHSIDPKNMEISSAEFRRICLEAGFIEMPLEAKHILGLESLTQKEGYPLHKDPFDRILLAQAQIEGMTFMTHDQKIATFDTKDVILV